MATSRPGQSTPGKAPGGMPGRALRGKDDQPPVPGPIRMGLTKGKRRKRSK